MIKLPKNQSIRFFVREDIPQVSDMLQRLLLSEAPSNRMLPADKLPDYLEETFFDNPMLGLLDGKVAPLVYQGKDGRIVGFIALSPRKMLFRDEPIRVLISLHLMVEVESRATLASVELLKTIFAGRQDLLITDGAGDSGRKVWEGIGGSACLLYSQRWIRILRPAQQMLSSIGKHGPWSGNPSLAYFSLALTPFLKYADAAAIRMLPRYFPAMESSLSAEPLEIDTVLTCLPKFTKRYALRPAYDRPVLEWLFKQAEQMRVPGEFWKNQLRNSRGEIVGWYMYYLKAGGPSSVIQLAAKRGAEGEVLDHLFQHAWLNGATALSGRLEPKFAQEMADRGCFFNRIGNSTMLHSNNPEILHAIQRGDAFLTQLEGEWCVTP